MKQEPEPALVVLAAGASERLGTCKALVELGVGPASCPLELLLEAGRVVRERVVIGGKHEPAIRARCPYGVRCVPNPAWAQGRTGSVAAAVRALPNRDLMLAPVDVPLVPRRVFRALLCAWEEAGRPANGWLGPFPATASPRFDRKLGQRRFGHPIVIGRELIRVLPEWPADRPLRELRGLASPLLALEVDAGEILHELNTPEDLTRLQAILRPGNDT